MNYETILSYYDKPFNDLLFEAATIHRENFSHNEIQLSSLVSIKTGKCPEDCKYCPQSIRATSNIDSHSLMSKQEILQHAHQIQKNGGTRICMGAGWRNLHDRNIDEMSDILKSIKEETNLETCVTLGMINSNQADKLKEAGLDYYNHNIDSSEEYYEKIITTRKYSERLETLKNVANANINVCCGGIIGMGETRIDRAKMIATLTELDTPPKSVPINRFVAVAGTELGDQAYREQELNSKDRKIDIDNFEFVRTIAITRIALPSSFVRLSAGRENMSDEMQSLCFFAGANSIFYGNKLLTTENPECHKDRNLLEELGIQIASS